MDTDKHLLVINGRQQEDAGLAAALLQKGYNLQFHSIHQPLQIKPDWLHKPKILLLDKQPCLDSVNRAIQSCGMINLLVTHSESKISQTQFHKYAIEIASIPCDYDELILRLQRSIFTTQAHSSQSHSCASMTSKALLQQNLIGQSESFLSAISLLQRYVDIDAPVLITGETGTGKELAARALHYASDRKSMPFQALNCGAIPDHLVENELFGHVRGAFTDARENQAGLIALAEGGTLFLDEVDSLSFKAQTALLRFLQDHTFRQIGGNKLQNANVRIVSATNTDLEKLSQQNSFRQDLMFRLNTLPLHLPPLRYRKKDILYLAEHFLKDCELDYEQGKKYFHVSVKEKILQYPWPGNVRELENYVKRAYLLSTNNVILIEPDNKNPVEMLQAEMSEEIATENFDSDNMVEFSKAKKAVVDDFEYNYINNMLNFTRGNVSLAAKLSGKERRVFGKLMKKHQIARTAFVK